MAISLKTSPDGTGALLPDLISGARRVGTATMQGASRRVATVIRLMQLSRVQQCLHEMNDAQLAQIGITRADINSYAASLVDGKIDRD